MLCGRKTKRLSKRCLQATLRRYKACACSCSATAPTTTPWLTQVGSNAMADVPSRKKPHLTFSAYRAHALLTHSLPCSSCRRRRVPAPANGLLHVRIPKCLIPHPASFCNAVTIDSTRLTRAALQLPPTQAAATAAITAAWHLFTFPRRISHGQCEF